METLQNTAAPFAIRFPAMVESLYKDPNSATKGNGIENAIAMQFAAMGTHNSAFKRETFRTLLLVVFEKKCYGILRNPGYIEVLGNVATFGNKMVNLPETWVKDNLTAEGQLASLIQHLFTQYEVPAFMEHTFAQSSKIHMLWYIQLGRGDSVMSLCGFPVALTRKMAHAFRETPAGINIQQAIRWAQAIGYGADTGMADKITWSVALEEIADNGFRAAVIYFVVKNAGDIYFAEMQRVIEYLAEMHRQDAAYSLKGRTWVSVTRMADEFHSERAKRLAAEARLGWGPGVIGGYEAVEDTLVVTITELTSSEALYEEGCEMSHCVADYDTDCKEGRTAIFSLRAFNGETEVHALRATLEVSLETQKPELVQAKAICNQEVTEEAETHILAWAAQESILVACELYSNYYLPQPAAGFVPAEPAIQLPAEMPRIVPVPRFDPEEAYRRRAPAEAPKSGLSVDAATVFKIIAVVVKLMLLASRCSQGG